MKKSIFRCGICALILGLWGCQPDRTVTFDFDSNKIVSGRKVALKEIAPDLPSDWSDYDYVTIEFRSTTPQRFQLGFTTDHGYNELRLVSYVANGWNKLVIPLRFFRELPTARHDIAATSNQPRVTGWINLGGQRGPLTGVDSIGIRMRAPIGNPQIKLRSITLSKEDPGDRYLEKVPAFDRFGQWNLGDFEGKIHSEEQLRQEWAQEMKTIDEADDFNYSRYGGYKNKRVASTGFFRTQLVDGRWWLVDPDGYLFLSYGVDCVAPAGDTYTKNIDQCTNLFQELPPRELFVEAPGVSPQTHAASFGIWNLFRRYGENYIDQACEMTLKRMDKWGLNTIANWSDPEIYGRNQKAFIIPLGEIGFENELMGLMDVYDPSFPTRIDEAVARQVADYKENPWLIGYFIGNEPAWVSKEDRLCTLILKGNDRPIKAALQTYLQQQGDTPQSRKAFIYTTFEKLMTTISQALKKHDPNHLNLGIRYGYIEQLDDELLRISKESFDALSFNCYALAPDPSKLDHALKISGLPMIIGEYHFGTVDRGLAQSLWQVNSQKERGEAFRYYTENAFAHPGLIGTGWFRWADQNINGRNDGENYNCGFIDVTDRPYPYMVEAAIATAHSLYDIHAGTKAPTNKAPEAVGHSPIPDLWD
ncbi:hypothetical protein [Barnesiella viscericola]|uniref:hypothetical protein n=1 Tax=Barnesiella viscericola TaxID=397865 RepID=UPI00235300CD|nr:hypothetical protein [Barnesiella viscericola]